MKTSYFSIADPERPKREELGEAAAMLRAGKLVAFPTETVYGLGANALDADAVTAIFAAKGRPADNPLIVHVADPADAEKYAEPNALYQRLAEAFMPGPLTVILPRRECVPDAVTAGLDSVAIRCPAHPTAHLLIELAGVPVAAPSANTSGRPSPTTAEHVRTDMAGKIAAIIDGGACAFGLESTVVRLEGEAVIVLRPGAVTADALRCVAEDVRVDAAVTEEVEAGAPVLSPGMKYRHYAPSAPLTLVDGEHGQVLEFFQAQQKEGNCGILCYDEDIPKLNARYLLPIGPKEEIAVQAHRLFARLREADALGVDRLYGYLPEKEGLSLALYNRLIRAAAHTVLNLREEQGAQ